MNALCETYSEGYVAAYADYANDTVTRRDNKSDEYRQGYSDAERGEDPAVEVEATLAAVAVALAGPEAARATAAGSSLDGEVVKHDVAVYVGMQDDADADGDH